MTTGFKIFIAYRLEDVRGPRFSRIFGRGPGRGRGRPRTSIFENFSDEDRDEDVNFLQYRHRYLRLHYKHQLRLHDYDIHRIKKSEHLHPDNIVLVFTYTNNASVAFSTIWGINILDIIAIFRIFLQ